MKTFNDSVICYASKANSLLIRSNGRIGKCTVAFDDDRNDVGYLNSEGRVITNKDKFSLWYRGIEALDAGICGCLIQGMPAMQSNSSFTINVVRKTHLK